MKKKYKKIFSLGAVALAVTPMASVAACGYSGYDSKIAPAISNKLTAKNYKDQITFKNGTLTIKKNVTSIEPKALDAFYKDSKPRTLTILGPVSKIEANIFTSWKSLTTINLNNELRTVDANAFESAVLTSLTIPHNLSSIGNMAFKSSPLTTLTCLDQSSLETIGDNAFEAAQLTAFKIPNTVTSIGNNAFQNAKLTALVIPSSITHIGDSAFEKSVLASLAFEGDVAHTQTSGFLGANTFKATTLFNIADHNWNSFLRTNYKSSFAPDPTREITLTADNAAKYSSYDDTTHKLTISNIYNDHIIAINTDAFASYWGGANKKEVTELVLPDTLQTIGNNAFEGAILTSLTLPKSLTSIGDSAFQNVQLTTLEIPAPVTHIGANAFEKSVLTTLTFKGDVAHAQTTGFLAADTFKGTNLFSITDSNWSNFLRTNYSSSFAADPERDITLTAANAADYTTYDNTTHKLTIANKYNDHIIGIDTDAFASYWTDKKEVTELALPDTLQTIGNNAFEGAQLTSVTIPNSVTSIGNLAFGNSQLTTLTLPTSLTTIGGYAFHSAKLTTLAIPDHVTSIGDTAFGSSALTTLTFSDKSSLETIADNAFAASPLTTLTLPNTLKTIGTAAFGGAQLTSLTIPSSVISIGNHTFAGSPLTTLTFADNSSLEKIDAYAFINARITSLILPSSLTYIGQTVFQSAALTHLVIPSNMTMDEIGSWVFYKIVNNASTTVSMPNSFNTDEIKNTLFNDGNWDKITFDYT